MVDYKIKSVDGKFRVYEVQTEQFLHKFKSHSDAKKQIKKLNNGEGFEGWTPNFIASVYEKT